MPARPHWSLSSEHQLLLIQAQAERCTRAFGCVQALYNQAWGWQDMAKRKELAHSGARFLLARDAEGRPHAFAHFRCSFYH